MIRGPAQAAGAPEQKPGSADAPISGLPFDPRLQMLTMASHLDANGDYVVVKVQDQPITNRDLATVIRTMPTNMGGLPYSEIYNQALDVLVKQKVMALNGRAENLQKDPVVRHLGELALERVLADAWLKKRMDAAVTDTALHELYDKRFAGQPGVEETRARVILVPTEAEAATVIKTISGGADFGEVALHSSKDPTSAQGGDLGYLPREATTPELAAVIFSLSPGQMTQYPVATRNGYFVIRVEGRRTRRPPTFDEVRPQLEEKLRADAMSATLNKLFENVKVVNPTRASDGDKAKP